MSMLFRNNHHQMFSSLMSLDGRFRCRITSLFKIASKLESALTDVLTPKHRENK